MGKAHSDLTKRRAFRALDAGENMQQVARKLNVNRATIAIWQKNRKDLERKLSASSERIARWNDTLPPPLFEDEMDRVARDCLDDFERWRYRYFGRRSRPWQVEAANRAIEWVYSTDTEYAVVNCPPGSGKTTLFTHDIPGWLICKNRAIRILLGHSAGQIARTYSRNLRRTFEHTRPLPADHQRDAAAGCLAEDYGRFRPLYQESWRENEWTVMLPIDADNLDESALESKEATVTAFGFDAQYLGTRADFVIWDDLVTAEVLHTAERITKQRSDWDTEGETRVEPGGCLLLQGQRMGHDDLFHYALSQDYEDEVDPEDEDYSESGIVKPRYHHIVYSAHDDEHCKGPAFHRIDSPPWPEGCLLDPYRIRWRGSKGLNAMRQKQRAVYDVQYQQRDVSASDVLVPELWIDGGLGEDGVDYPGCWDNHRDILDLPRGLNAPYFSVVSVDPSATNFWAVEHWIYHPASQSRFLVNFHHDRMTAPDLIDYNPLTDSHYGLLHEWVSRARTTAFPITHIVVEVNAAQKYLLAYNHIKTWQRIYDVSIIPHQTNINKLDPDRGIESIREHYKFGRVRLPGTPAARNIIARLVYEATRYEPAKPKAIPDDCLMAQWFFEYNLQSIAAPRAQYTPTQKRPSWMRRKVA